MPVSVDLPLLQVQLTLDRLSVYIQSSTPACQSNEATVHMYFMDVFLLDGCMIVLLSHNDTDYVLKCACCKIDVGLKCATNPVFI